MTATSIWKGSPLYNRIIEILEERGGIIKDKELFELLKEETDISFADFLKALLDLEVRGLIRVQLASEDLRIVELANKLKYSR